MPDERIRAAILNGMQHTPAGCYERAGDGVAVVDPAGGRAPQRQGHCDRLPVVEEKGRKRTSPGKLVAAGRAGEGRMPLT